MRFLTWILNIFYELRSKFDGRLFDFKDKSYLRRREG